MTLPAERILARIRALPHTPGGGRRLAAMLPQNAAHYRGLSAGDADWVRGHILAAFEHRTAPDAALAPLAEDLRTSLSPVVLAGAARAVRGLPEPDGRWRDLLAAAAERLAFGDEYVRFEDGAPPRTAREEIAAALDALPACCTATGAAAPGEAPVLKLCPHALGPVVLEDQDGARAELVALLRSRPSLVAFFYTRCMNPAKCSLTITRQAALAAHLHTTGRAGEVNVLAVSYDGDFDTAPRLREFGVARGFGFGETARLARCASGWPAVRRQFALQVGYGDVTVNAHAREVFAVSPGLVAHGLDAEILADPAAALAALNGEG